MNILTSLYDLVTLGSQGHTSQESQQEQEAGQGAGAGRRNSFRRSCRERVARRNSEAEAKKLR